MNQYPQYSNYQPKAGAVSVPDAMKLVYIKMTLALVVTGLISFFCSQSYGYLSFMFANRWAMFVLMLVEVVLVISISSGLRKLSSPAATALFYLFAVVNGLMLAPIFLIYTGASIAKTFFITAGTFGAMSVFGYTTGQDLSKVGNILFMALIGLIIASVVNIFAHSDTLNWIISFAGVIIFVGLTAWDTQRIKQMAAVMPADQTGRLATIGALSLYLDFINLFLYLLRFFGSSRD